MGRIALSIDPVASLINSGRLKLAFDRVVASLAIIDPRLSYSMRNAVRAAFFPILGRKRSTAPLIREDLPLYAGLFHQALENFESIVTPYIGEINWPLARVYNYLFESVDAELYYCIVRSFRPDRIVEVGAGNSTWFARDAIRANGKGQISAIDPSPRLALPRECRHLSARVEQVPTAIFTELDANDILFFDSSHTTAEAMYHIDRVLPSLRPGVLIHYHDILFPYLSYSAAYVPDRKTYAEQDLILRFLRDNQGGYEVVTSSAFSWYEAPAVVRRLIRSKDHDPARAAGSLWIRKLVGA